MLSNRQWHHHLSTKVPTEGQYVCVCPHVCERRGILQQDTNTHTHTPSLSRCFSSLVSSPLRLALLLEVLIRRHSANVTTSHIKLGWVRRMVAIFVCLCVGGLCLVLCEWEEHICLCVCVCVCEGPPGSSCCRSFKCLRGRWSDLPAPTPGREGVRRTTLRFLRPPFISLFHPRPPPSLIPDSLSSLCH